VEPLEEVFSARFSDRDKRELISEFNERLECIRGRTRFARQMIRFVPELVSKEFNLIMIHI
jgi:hypothetical protein